MTKRRQIRTQNSNGLVTAPSPSFGAFLKPFWAMPILLFFPLQMDSYFSPIRASWILRIVAVAILRGRCRSRPRFTQHDAVQTLEGRTKYVPLSPKFQSQSGSVDVAYFTSYYSFYANSPFEFPIAWKATLLQVCLLGIIFCLQHVQTAALPARKKRRGISSCRQPQEGQVARSSAAQGGLKVM